MELPAPGQIFQRKYKLQDVLGRGGFAAVYRATDIEIGRDVAIKVLAPGEDGYSTGIASRFMREARVIGGFQDPHTITMFEFGRSDDGLLFMVFEYVRGDDLAKVIRKRGPLPQDEVHHILKQVLQSLREAHANSVLHRDIKPANILVYDYMGDPNRVKLLDFGIAKAVAGDEAGINLTREGAMIGTPRYMSPEQIYGGDLTPRSDLYSLGLVAHEMLVGKPAITGTTSKEMLRAQLADDPVRLPRQSVLATEAFCDVIDCLTSRDPEERFQDAAEVMQALSWVENNDVEVPAGPIAGMNVQGVSPAYNTPSSEWPRSEERSWERSGPLPGHQSGAIRAPNQSGGVPAYTPRPDSGHFSGAQPVPGRSGPHQPPQQQRPPSGGYPPPGSGAYPAPHDPGAHHSTGRPITQDESMYPPSTERPRTFEDDDGDMSLGTMLGAGLGAAALVVGLLMLMSFLGQRDDAAPEPVPEIETNSGAATSETEKKPRGAESTPSKSAPAATPDVGEADSAAKPPPSGCGDAIPWRGENVITVADRSGPRDAVAYLPVKYQPDRRYPVVLMFHPNVYDGRKFLSATKFKAVADEGEFIVIAPDARNPTQPWSKADMPVMAKFVERLAGVACVDQSRVYAIGQGQGAAMARDLACHMPLSAVAFAGHGLRAGEQLCAATPAVPTIRFQGKHDRYVPFRGGVGCMGSSFQSISSAEDAWKKRNACGKGKPKLYDDRGDTECFEYDCEATFVSCHLDGGHDWPGSAPRGTELPGCVSKQSGYPLGDQVWKFFDEHGLDLSETR